MEGVGSEAGLAHIWAGRALAVAQSRQQPTAGGGGAARGGIARPLSGPPLCPRDQGLQGQAALPGEAVPVAEAASVTLLPSPSSEGQVAELPAARG